jgi:hypothetical protein
MERIDKMEKLVESREAKVSVGRHELNVMYARMDRQPTDAFTMNLIKHPSSFVFSEANVDLLNERLEEVCVLDYLFIYFIRFAKTIEHLWLSFVNGLIVS